MWYMIVFIVVMIVILFWWMGRPVYRRNVGAEDFERFLRDFLGQMGDGAIMIIEHQDSPKFIQFAKYGSHPPNDILRFGFPDAPWSRRYFDPMAEKLRSIGVDFNITTTGEDLTRRFLLVDFEKEDLEIKISKGTQVAKVAFEVMGLDVSAKFRIHFEGTVSPEAARPSLEALRDAPNKLVRRFSRHYLKKLNSKKN